MCHIFVDIVWENWGFRILHISMSLSYHLVVFETSVPHGETSGERVLHLARSIFPELRYDYPNVSPSLLTKIKRTLKKKANKTDQEINQSAQDLWWLFPSGCVPGYLTPGLYSCANQFYFRLFLFLVYVQSAGSNVQFHHASFKMVFNFYAWKVMQVHSFIFIFNGAELVFIRFCNEVRIWIWHNELSKILCW